MSQFDAASDRSWAGFVNDPVAVRCTGNFMSEQLAESCHNSTVYKQIILIIWLEVVDDCLLVSDTMHIQQTEGELFL